jgi:hypothetical protein
VETTIVREVLLERRKNVYIRVISFCRIDDHPGSQKPLAGMEVRAGEDTEHYPIPHTYLYINRICNSKSNSLDTQ